MWIMGADGKELADVKFFKIQRNMGNGKDKKWAIVGYSQTTAATTLTGLICAYFSDEDRAITGLEKVVSFIEENPGKVIRFDKF